MTTNQDKNRVLIVDDSPQDIQIILEYLKDNYIISAATSGQAGIDKATGEQKPDVILMDVSMPGMDGYEACKAIIEQDDNADIIFVSANDTTEEILKGYDVGGIDYVIKPFDPDVLSSKIELVIQNRQQKNALKEESQFASKTAMAAMSNSSELGIIMNFMRSSFQLDSLQALAQSVTQVCSQYKLNATVQLRSEYQTINHGSTLPISPLEEKLLDRIQHMKERFTETEKRLFINYQDVSLLVKNMPYDDEELSGRLKDYLITLAEAAQAKIATLNSNHELSQKRNTEMTHIIEECKKALENFQQAQEKDKKDTMTILDDTIKELESSFVDLALTEAQEEQLITILNAGVDASLAHFESSSHMDSDLQHIISQLEKLIDT